MAASLRDRLRIAPGEPVDLAALDPRATPLAPGGKSATKAAMEQQGGPLAALQEALYAQATTGAPARVLVVLQGMDTSGKGGVIEHVIGLVNPQGVQISSFKKPTPAELRHHFLWRIRRAVPRRRDDRHLRPVALRGRAGRPGAPAGPGRRRSSAGTRRSPASSGGWSPTGSRWSSASCTCRTTSSGSGCWPGWTTRPSTGSSTRATWPSGPAGPTTRRRTGSRWSGAPRPEAPWYAVPADRKWYRNWAVGTLLLETLRELDPRYPTPELDVRALKKRLAPPN